MSMNLRKRIAVLKSLYEEREKHVGIAGKTLKAFDIAEMMPEAMALLSELLSENERLLADNDMYKRRLEKRVTSLLR